MGGAVFEKGAHRIVRQVTVDREKLEKSSKYWKYRRLTVLRLSPTLKRSIFMSLLHDRERAGEHVNANERRKPSRRY